MQKMLANSFLTYKILLEIKYKDKNYHMISILTKNGPNVDFNDNTAVFDKTFESILKIAETVISVNNNLEGNFSKIIIEPVGTSNNGNIPQPTQPTNPQNPRNPRDNRTPGPQPALQPTTAPNQAFNINPNTYIDDE